MSSQHAIEIPSHVFCQTGDCRGAHHSSKEALCLLIAIACMPLFCMQFLINCCAPCCDCLSAQDPVSQQEAFQQPHDFSIKLTISNFFQGSRFAILHGDGPRPSFSIYAMKSDLKTTVKGVDLIGTQPNKQANQIHWSPQGKYLVLGGLKVSLNKH